MKYIFEVCGMYNGKEAGFVGFFLTKKAALAARSDIPVRIKRIRIEEGKVMEAAVKNG